MPIPCLDLDTAMDMIADRVLAARVMEARARGATVIHVDPRFTRTSAAILQLLLGNIGRPGGGILATSRRG